MPYVNRKKIISLREGLGLSPEELAIEVLELKTNDEKSRVEEKKGINEATIYRIECGQTTRPSYRIVRLLAKVLGVKTNDIILPKPKKPKKSSHKLIRKEMLDAIDEKISTYKGIEDIESDKSSRNFGYDYFIRIIEYLYKAEFNYKIFHPEYEHDYVNFKKLILESKKLLPVISFDNIKKWKSEGLYPNIALNTWDRLKILTNLIIGKNKVAKNYEINELKHYKKVIEDLINLFKGNIETPHGKIENFDIKETLEPLSDNLINFFPVVLNVKVKDDLSKLIYNYDSEVLEIKNPKLLIETLEKENKKFKLEKGGWVAPGKNIFDKSKKSILIRKYFGRNTLIEFDYTKINWIASLSPWPPSIDALFLTSTIKRIHREKGSIFKFPIYNIADIGCGTGFLGIFLSSLIQTIKKVYYSDINHQSTRLALSNHKTNKLNSEYFGMSGFGLKPFQKKNDISIDTILCNPPYIPTFGPRLPSSHPVLSSGFLFDVITQFSWISKSLLSCISLIANDEIERALNTIYKNHSSLKHEILDSLWVPFRIRTINEDNLEVLAQKGLILDLYEGQNQNTLGKNITEENFKDNRSFRYWHQINIHKFYI